MKLTIQERIELTRIFRGFSSDKTSEIEVLKGAFDKINLTQEDRAKFQVIEGPQGYQIGFEQENDYLFTEQETELLSKLYTVVESNHMVNLNNLSLMKKIREV